MKKRSPPPVEKPLFLLLGPLANGGVVHVGTLCILQCFFVCPRQITHRIPMGMIYYCLYMMRVAKERFRLGFWDSFFQNVSLSWWRLWEGEFGWWLWGHQSRWIHCLLEIDSAWFKKWLQQTPSALWMMLFFSNLTSDKISAEKSQLYLVTFREILTILLLHKEILWLVISSLAYRTWYFLMPTKMTRRIPKVLWIFVEVKNLTTKTFTQVFHGLTKNHCGAPRNWTKHAQNKHRFLSFRNLQKKCVVFLPGVFTTSFWWHLKMEAESLAVSGKIIEKTTQVSSVQKLGWLSYGEVYTTHLYGDCNKLK